MIQHNIFIASSSELMRERNELVDLLQDLSREHKEQGIKFKSVRWEYMDSSMRAERKEDEYLVRLRECEVCIVLFWNILGQYTVEELDVAVAEMQAGRIPKKIYVLFKEPMTNIQAEMVGFKEHFAERYPSIPIDRFVTNNELRDKISQLICV